MLLGLATGAVYYPVFLLPLWCAFYWHRGLLRFASGFGSMLAMLVATLAFTSSNLQSFLAQAKLMLGWTSFSLNAVDVEGFWAMSPSIAVSNPGAGRVLCAQRASHSGRRKRISARSCRARQLLCSARSSGTRKGAACTWPGTCQFCY